jgi:hypothetical protein
MDDKKSLDLIIAKFFKAFVSSDIGVTQLQDLTSLFIPQAIVIKTCGATAVYSLKEFIDPRQKILTDGTLLKFHEHEITERTEIFGDIAQRLCIYQKSGVLNGKSFVEKGVKTIQFVKIDQHWKISSLSWEDERPDLLININL